jgi:L-alanine-DL-glutamate epimerase-like enolase superfamily enzyme
LKSDTTIISVETFAYKIPTDFPEGDGTLEWNSTTAVVVILKTPFAMGTGYTYADVSAAVLIESVLRPILLNNDAMNIMFLWNEMLKKTRNLGRAGITSMAISAVDAALWDLKAKLLNVSLIDLLGKVKDKIPVYGSGGFTTYTNEKLEEQFSEWASIGIHMMKMKIGRDFLLDKKRIKVARDVIGNAVDLFIDANGAYSTRQAIEMANFAEQLNVTWFEEPVISDDIEGLSFVRRHAPANMDITAGEYGYDYFYFRRMLQAEAIDVLQIDATRCAGITGFLDAVSISKSYNISNSAHTAPAIHVAPCCSTNNVRHIEYFHDHVRIEKMLFDGIPELHEGCLKPNADVPGCGIELKIQDVENFRINFK